MRKPLVVVGFSVLFAATAVADRINFLIGNGPIPSLNVSVAGLSSSTPDGLVQVENVTKDIVIPLTGGSLSIITGPVSSPPVVSPPLALFVFNASGRNSIIIDDSMGNMLLAGTLNAQSTFFTGFPNLQGSFLSSFTVTFVQPALLAALHTGPTFEPSGSVSATFLGDNCDVGAQTCTGQLSTAGVSIQTPVPEPTGLGALGMGLLGVAGGWLRRRRSAPRK